MRCSLIAATIECIRAQVCTDSACINVNCRVRHRVLMQASSLRAAPAQNVPTHALTLRVCLHLWRCHRLLFEHGRSRVLFDLECKQFKV